MRARWLRVEAIDRLRGKRLLAQPDRAELLVGGAGLPPAALPGGGGGPAPAGAPADRPAAARRPGGRRRSRSRSGRRASGSCCRSRRGGPRSDTGFRARVRAEALADAAAARGAPAAAGGLPEPDVDRADRSAARQRIADRAAPPLRTAARRDPHRAGDLGRRPRRRSRPPRSTPASARGGDLAPARDRHTGSAARHRGAAGADGRQRDDRRAAGPGHRPALRPRGRAGATADAHGRAHRAASGAPRRAARLGAVAPRSARISRGGCARAADGAGPPPSRDRTCRRSRPAVYRTRRRVPTPSRSAAGALPVEAVEARHPAARSRASSRSSAPRRPRSTAPRASRSTGTGGRLGTVERVEVADRPHPAARTPSTISRISAAPGRPPIAAPRCARPPAPARGARAAAGSRRTR